MLDNTGGTEHDEMERTRVLGQGQSGAPSGARQNVRLESEEGAVARPSGATQNSGGELESNCEEGLTGPGRGGD